MDIPVMKTWIDGETVTPQDLNEQIRDPANFLMTGRPSCRIAKRVNGQTIPYGQWTPVAMDTVEYDTDSIWDSGNPDTFTVSTAGVYLITGLITYSPDGDPGVGRIARIYSPTRGSTLADMRTTKNASWTTPISVSTLAYLPVGEVLELHAYTDSSGGTPLSIAPVGGTEEYCHLSMIWIGG